MNGTTLVHITAAAALASGFVPGAGAGPARAQAPGTPVVRDPALTTVFPAPRPKGLMVTTGGWAYCEQIKPVARRTGYTLLCGRYDKDGYTGPGLRTERRLDWGDPAYLTDLARTIEVTHRRIGGKLVLIGVSYSGFGVATLASHHPELRPDQLIVIDSYLDLVARRNALPDRHETAVEIDAETGGTRAELRRRSVSIAGLARLVRTRTALIDVWSISPDEKRFFDGATCSRDASAVTLARLATAIRRPVRAWVTTARHGHTLWGHGAAIVGGRVPGREVVFRPDGRIPPGSIC